ncbi:division/cell wall cluster transcriptional repressor MraZ [Clostridium celatum]|uniref:Transcriptional regulator MraZ n=1 Tax=Clostridium celatum DSM 1785 TaxID=545697 RepID=L1QG23_9CLOT|nr:division/cell wall cluster transcriptional repressor MraZ [Clostridium celatum]EKY26954.1 protein MraZ [Clostridium celatum DSM 1785]MCE9654786.1 division/cell wall cluster transcriptional repressor MraZ [Clostridium celatum]MDU3722428.1 division/cell wall cluster transcriptional repressor MraZ [Clostridium celatum]MDU6294815.1 division/cell wall cluster transcriptional repressor MraZ [Clostridium celatum]MDY3359215.1 division/cell wall cluster transcriptional repressor MraZ [Clostridium ce
MFIGEYQHSLDNKNRIVVPSKLREELGEKFVITKGLDGCLYAYPQKEWIILEEKLKKLPLTNKEARAFVRFFFSGACEVETDKQGRGLIPLNLKEYAGIEKEIVSIGALTKVEIWSKEKWQAYNELNIDFNSIAEKMGDLGI